MRTLWCLAIGFGLLFWVRWGVVSAEIPTDQVGYWQFEEGTGMISADSSGVGNMGILTNSVTFTTTTAPIDGANSSAVAFDGVGGYVQVGTGISNTLVMTDALTMMAWVYPMGVGSNPEFGGIIMSKEGEYQLARWGDGTIRWVIRNSTPGWAFVNTGYVAPLNEWTHLALTYSEADQQAIFYVNGNQHGQPVTATGLIGDQHTDQNDFRIGGRQRGGANIAHFDGIIDEVQLFKRALTQAEIRVASGQQKADVMVAKSVSHNQATAGQTLTYTLRFANVGNGLATGVVITDSLPAEAENVAVVGSSGVAVTQIGSAPMLVWEVENMPVGAVGFITYTVTAADVAAIYTLENVVDIAAEEPVWSQPIGTDTTTTICPTTLTVADEAQMNGAIGCFNAATIATTFTIDLTNSLSLSSALTVISNAHNGVNLHVMGNNHTLTPPIEEYGLDITTGTRVEITSLTIQNSNGNSGLRNRGTLTVRDSTFSDNSTNFFSGGGIDNVGTLTIYDSVFSGNLVEQDRGGGINNRGVLTIYNSTFNGNSVIHGDGGGAIANNGTLTIYNSTFSGNSSLDSIGGGIFNDGTLTIYNSTLTGNSAEFGGGIFNSGTLTVHNSTLSGNSAINSGGGIDGGDSNATFHFFNTIIANSSGGEDCVLTFGGTIVTSRNNLIEDTGANACNIVDGVDGNIVGTPPMLAGLANNGGATQTHALQVGSPAIDAGDSATCRPQDQRGFGRSGTCDIGAFEFAGVPTAVTLVVQSTEMPSFGKLAFLPAASALFILTLWACGRLKRADGDIRAFRKEVVETQAHLDLRR